MTHIDTRKVQGRRVLRFATADEVKADAEALVAAESQGRLVQLGNWSLGQALNHLGAWASYPHEGYPASLRPPWIVRFLSRLFKKHYLTKGLTPGVRIPGIAAGTTDAEPTPTAEGHARFVRAIDRLAAVAPTSPNPLFGPLTHDEWLQLNLRHAELHLSFFKVQA